MHNIDWRAKGQTVRHGDKVVLRHDGKYMALIKGWWMKWASDAPRKSGAFIVEIVEKAKQNLIKEQLSAFKDKISKATSGVIPRLGLDMEDSSNSALCVGDLFVLRSMKYPEYELGITSVKLGHADAVYLGLRKSEADGSAKASEWSQKTYFHVK